jgi:hypothetical protein
VASVDKTIEVVNEFLYLGSLVTPNNNVCLEIKKDSDCKKMILWTAQKIAVGHLSSPTKFIIYKTLIRPVSLYGSETWVLTRREEKQLFVFKRRISARFMALKLKMVCTGGDTILNPRKSSTARVSSTL